MKKRITLYLSQQDELKLKEIMWVVNEKTMNKTIAILIGKYYYELFKSKVNTK